MKNTIYIAIAVLLIAALAWWIRRKNYFDMENEVWDKLSEDKIKTLHPEMQDVTRRFINQVETELGLRLRVVSANRSHAEQEKMYAQGRTAPGQIITNAKPGSSFHNFGLAFDVAPIINGKVEFENVPWAKIAAIAKKLGLRWGGDFKNIVDKPHFEKSFGKTLAQLQSLYAAKRTDKDGYVLIA